MGSVTAGQVEQMQALRAQGRSYADIAKLLGLGKSTVVEHLAVAKVASPGQPGLPARPPIRDGPGSMRQIVRSLEARRQPTAARPAAPPIEPSSPVAYGDPELPMAGAMLPSQPRQVEPSHLSESVMVPPQVRILYDWFRGRGWDIDGRAPTLSEFISYAIDDWSQYRGLQVAVIVGRQG